MIQSHISDDILTSYAAGSLDEASSLLVACHLSLCPHCRVRAAKAEQLGGFLLDALEETAVSPDMMANVLAHLPAPAAKVSLPELTEPHLHAVLPAPLRDYVGGDISELRWKRVAPKVHQIAIPMKDKRAQARLLRFRSGMMVPCHGHNGRELTLVLTGSLCDHTSTLFRGDVAETDERTEHQPFAGSGEDCICLAVTDAPLRFKSVFARILQPLLGI
jgi:putative transcriptional regulator